MPKNPKFEDFLRDIRSATEIHTYCAVSCPDFLDELDNAKITNMPDLRILMNMHGLTICLDRTKNLFIFRKLREFDSEWRRTGDLTCEDCGYLYSEHPFQDFLHVLCDGRMVKL